MTARYAIFFFVIIVGTAWLDGYLKGKVEARAKFEAADELVRHEADWLTQLQVAQTKEAGRDDRH